MSSVLTADQVVERLPDELRLQLAEVAGIDDRSIEHVLELFDEEFGLRGSFIHDGMVEVCRQSNALSFKLRPFGREVAVGCRVWRDKHHPDDVPAALAKIERERQERETAAMPQVH